MTIYHILMFICGGFFSVIIFYPKNNKKYMEKRVDYLSILLAHNFFTGIQRAQRVNEEVGYKLLFQVETEDQLQTLSLTAAKEFKKSAVIILKGLDEL